MKAREKSKVQLLVAVCFILINLIIQICGNINYKTFPVVFFALGNCILLMSPLIFELPVSLLCLAPTFVSEIYWWINTDSIGPLLHLASFVLFICLLTFCAKKMVNISTIKRMIITSLFFEGSILAEEYLYYLLRYLLMPSHPPVSWAAVSGTIASPANPVILCIGLLSIAAAFADNERKESPTDSDHFEGPHL